MGFEGWEEVVVVLEEWKKEKMEGEDGVEECHEKVVWGLRLHRVEEDTVKGVEGELEEEEEEGEGGPFPTPQNSHGVGVELP